MQTPCAKCGQQHLTRTGKASCAGHKKHTGEPCTTPPVRGADKCRMHLGKKAAPVIAQARLQDAMNTYGLPIEIDPAEALLNEVWRTNGHVKWLQQRVAELEENDVIWGKTRVKTGGEDHGTTEEAKPNGYLVLYQEERKHLVRVSAEALRCGIEERRVKFAESQGALVADALRGILADLNLSAEQHALVPEVVSRHLRGLTA